MRFTATNGRFRGGSIGQALPSLKAGSLGWGALVRPALPVHGAGRSVRLVQHKPTVSGRLWQRTAHRCWEEVRKSKVIFFPLTCSPLPGLKN